MITWVTAKQLDSWAQTRDAQGRLPELLRKLAYATLDNPQRISFPSGESVQSGGWDGVIETPRGNPLVPAGKSLWELSTEKQVKSKADSDYSKRSDEPGDITPAECTFVFATARSWGGKEAWVAEKVAEGKWLDVRALDADDLEQWLEYAPAVGAWFAREIGRYPDGAQALLDHWHDWQGVTEPILPAELLVGARPKEAEAIRSWLSQAPSVVSLAAETVDEAIAFIAAVLEEAPDEIGQHFQSRALVVTDENSWRHLVAHKEPLLLIPSFDVTRVNLGAVKGHHVLIPLTASRCYGPNTISLGLLPYDHLRKVLVSAGVLEDRAGRLARDSGRRLSVLRRSLAIVPETVAPPWVGSVEAAQLAVFTLVGGWMENNENDRKVLEAIAKEPYHKLEQALSQWVNEADSPIRKVGDRWELISREDSWALLSDYISEHQLAAFFEQAEEVLGEINPRFELAPEERYLASIRGKAPLYSAVLRKNIAQTLALIAARGISDQASGARSAQDWVNRFAVRLFARSTTPDFWSSLSDVMPSIAEAAPEVFLRQVERDLAVEPSPVMSMFVEEGTFGSSPHTGLLWALEIFAWEPHFLTRVTLILGKLARLDPGGKLANRPASSLREIFLGWYPQTIATLDQRFQAIDELVRREPDAAWELLLALLPEAYSIATPISHPTWRAWDAGWAEGTTNIDYWKGVEAAADRVLGLVGTDGTRWSRVIEKLGVMPPPAQARALDLLTEASGHFAAADRVGVWNSLRRFLHHQHHYGGQPGFETDTGKRVVEIFEVLVPTDWFGRYHWLFGTNPELPDIETQDWREEQELIGQAQARAVSELMARAPLDIVRFAAEVENPRALGYTLGKSEMATDLEHGLLETATADVRESVSMFTMGLVAGRFASCGHEWIAHYLPNGAGAAWSATAKALFARGLPSGLETWDTVSACGEDVDRLYWDTVYGDRLPDGELAAHAITKLLGVGRPYAALELAAYQVETKSAGIPAGLLLTVMQQAITHDPKDERWFGYQSLDYHVGEIIDALERSGEIAEDDLARLEWAYLPLFEHGRHQPTILHRRLAQQPGLFVELLKLLFRANDQPKSEHEPSDVELNRIHNAYELLHSWHQVPGVTESGDVDGAVLAAWIGEVLALCKEARREAVADEQIGQLLSYGPVGKDGVWPHEAIREIVERLANEHLEVGIQMGIMNQRGAVWRALDEGGKQERELAQHYREDAARLASRWPRTAALLSELSDDYAAEAHREDLRVDED